MWVWVFHHRGFAIILFRLYVSVGPYSQRICYRSVQIAYECHAFITEDLLSSLSDCMWVWVLPHRGFTIVLFRVHLSVGPSSQRICYRPFQIACECAPFVTEDLLSSVQIACECGFFVTEICNRPFQIACDCRWSAIVLFSYMLMLVLHHRGFAIILFRLHGRVDHSVERFVVIHFKIGSTGT